MSLWGNTNGCGYFIIDENENDSGSRFAVYHHEIGGGTPPAGIPLPADDPRCLFQIAEVGSSDGIGKMMLGNPSSPAFEVNWNSEEVLLSDEDWTIKHSGNSSTADINVKSNADLNLRFGMESQSTSALNVYSGDAGTPTLEVKDASGTLSATLRTSLDVDKTITVNRGGADTAQAIFEDSDDDDHHLWVSNVGALRIADTAPTSADQATHGKRVAGFEVANVRDYGATGDGTTDDTTKIQAAIDDDLTVVFPAGIYRYGASANLNFDNEGQQIIFLPGAMLRPLSTTTAIKITGKRQVFRNMYVNTEDITCGMVQCLIDFDNAHSTVFENLRIVGSNATLGFKANYFVKCTFFGGSITGLDKANTTGLQIGDPGAALHGSYEFKAFRLSVTHWATGVHFKETASIDDPTFVACNIERNIDYGFRFESGTAYNLAVISCHFGKCKKNIHVGEDANILGATIQTCRFGDWTERIFDIVGNIRGMNVMSCFFRGGEDWETDDVYVWDMAGTAYQCIDFSNRWERVRFSTGANAGQLSRIDSPNGGNGLWLEDGTEVDLEAPTVNVDASTEVEVDTPKIELPSSTEVTGPELKISSTELGFFGATPVTQPGGFTISGSWSSTTTLNVEPASAENTADVLATLISKLEDVGLLST